MPVGPAPDRLEAQMRRTRRPRSVTLMASTMLVVATMFASHPAAARPRAATNVIFSFDGSSQGGYPDSDLVMDANGNLYGSAVEGGQANGGVVFELSPGPGGWTETILHNFTGEQDGAEPYGGVTLDPAGNVYGTAVTGGSGGCEGGCGVLYELTQSGGVWNETVIHAFTGGADGSGPGGGPTIDADGNVFGTAPTGGAFGMGVVYEASPKPAGGWTFQVIHAFTGGNDGATGAKGRLTLDARGALYGVATAGGQYGSGVAYRLSRTPAGRWRLKALYQFKGEPDAGFPYGALAFDAKGNLFGTSYYDGANDLGAVYELSPTPRGPWSERVLHSFAGSPDGASSISGLVFDAAGNMFGTTSEGGNDDGTIFELSPAGGGAWTETVVYAFGGPPDGAYPYDGVLADGAGHYFGTTVHGGTDDEGAIYEFTP